MEEASSDGEVAVGEDSGAASPPEKNVLFFGGVAEKREPKKEETEAMRVASRINEALAMRRMPKPAGEPKRFAETAWYDELGVSPHATAEELRLNYLNHAAEVEEQLAYLLEAGAPEEADDDRLLEGPDSEDDDYLDTTDFDEDGVGEDEDMEDEEAEAEVEAEDEAIMARISDGAKPEDFDMVPLRRPVPLRPGDSRAAGIAKQEEEETEADRIALNFRRISNLYQILSVPQLRRIYDEGGVELLAAKCPRLHHSLLEPERMLRMAQGLPQPLQEKESLLLRKEPKTKTFHRFQAANSIRQVLRRLTNVLRVWYFKSPKSLKRREGTIYTELPEIAVFGRVNSGKSSLLQHFLSAGKMKQKFYACPSQRPGKTTGIDVFAVNKRFTLADTPGYSYAKPNKHGEVHDIAIQGKDDWRTTYKPLLEEYLDTTPQLRAAIYVHEISKDPTPEDIRVVKMLKKRGLPVLLVFTKDDKVDSDSHRLSRVRRIRSYLHWPREWPHAYYCTRRGGYGRVFKNMLGTMVLGLLATETRQDAYDVLTNELPGIFHDYRDKYVPRPRGPFGKLPKNRRWRTYPQEDKVYTDEELREEELKAELQEKKERRKAKEARGEKWTTEDAMEEEQGTNLRPRDRRKRWEDLLAEVNG